MTRHGAMPLGGDNAPSSTYYDQGKFGRLFPSLPAFSSDNPTLRAALQDIGKIKGIMDAMDDLNDPVGLIVNPALNVKNENNPDITAGFTFLGQFIDHDLTFDPTSSLERQQDPETIANFRTPTLGLDNLYGAGPKATPHLYDQSIDSGLTTFLVEEIPGSEAISRDRKRRFDLPRNSQNTALIGDPRNDENLIVSQLHLAFLKFHNAVVIKVKQETGLTTANEIFAEAQRLVRWHYQWIIVNEFLPLTVGQKLVTKILTEGRKFYNWRNEPFIPVEFAVSAYRFGHSQARPSYRANFGPLADDSKQFIALFLDDGRPQSPKATDLDPTDLRGGKRSARRFIDWQTFFNFGDGRARPNKKIDTILSSALFDLPGIPGMEPQSLATRNMLRHITFRIPSGQSVAKAMREKPLDPSDLRDLQPYALDKRTPLWFYILREAQVDREGFGRGRHLGPVGGRIVAEVLIGLMQGDSLSYLRQDPGWIPTLSKDGVFKITDLLKFAGVVIPL
ncbi:MAG: heme peroxidase family protein [Alkalinema sp. CAN_BIN05]|nr:heme peroxidase family protein [Alkalinema sp. CAN_BIN05]